MRTAVDQRLDALEQWLHMLPGLESFTLAPASADASFRRYFRVTRSDGGTLIAMDAPPEKEDCGPFIDVTRRLEAVGLTVPHIHAENHEAGFLLLDDLGSRDYLQSLDTETADALYGAAIDALLRLQRADTTALPRYDAELLRAELALFTDWFLGRHLGITLDPEQQRTIETVFAALIETALEQPRVFVHRDYHSRNLMVTEPAPPGIIDYQDAVLGPVSYDLVSLLRDCYIDWPDERVDGWMRQFLDGANEQGQLTDISPDRFRRWFDLMGVQRHLKAIGIFARLNHRDGKPGYLGDIPRTLGYVLRIGERHTETQPLVALLQQLDLPARLDR